MMLIKCFREQDIEWYVGDKIPSKYHAVHTDIRLDVIEVYAEGPELKYIKHHFENLPYMRTLGVSWFGDHAKFIFANLR